MDQPVVDMCLFVGRIKGCNVAQPRAATWHPVIGLWFKILFGVCWSKTRDLHVKILGKGRATNPPMLVLNTYSSNLIFKLALRFS
jgi:hypothetical protein